MNPQITKEIHVLWPPLGILILVSLLPYHSMERSLLVALPIVFIISCVLMAGLAFGHEFQQRTISLLLAQPVPRRRIWLQKIGLLGMFLAVGAFSVVLAFYRFDPQLLTRSTESLAASFDSMWPPLIAITFISFCTVPLLTCLFRSTLLGVVFSFLVPGALLAINGLLCEYVLRKPAATTFCAYVILGLYAVICLGLGYRTFMHLEVIDGSALGREIELPQRWKKISSAAMASSWGKFESPTATLIKKELRLQQVTFLLAAIFCVIALLGAFLYSAQRGHTQQTNLGEVLLTADFVIYIVLLPLLAGSLALAEEKMWGVAEWQIMLPVSLLKQWGIKMLVTLSNSLLLGFFLPLGLLLIGQRWLGPSEAANSFSQWGPVQLLGYLIAVQLVVFAGSISGTTVRSILIALGLFGLIGCAIGATDWAFQHYSTFEEYLTYGRYVFEGDDGQPVGGRWMLFVLQMAVCFGLLQRFSFSGFRTTRVRPAWVSVQAGIIFLMACLMTLTALALHQ
ncbi:MAG TPA: hypothetical protein VMZ27_04855 [Candidatus Saccharimonadales bacterium]|nr:hypothetical protein [Candidatus Saccharimonadales bacterium]